MNEYKKAFYLIEFNRLVCPGVAVHGTLKKAKAKAKDKKTD
jgi:hypothetical protein